MILCGGGCLWQVKSIDLLRVPFTAVRLVSPGSFLDFAVDLPSVCLPLDFSPVFGFSDRSSFLPVRLWFLGQFDGHAWQGTLNELPLQCPRA